MKNVVALIVFLPWVACAQQKAHYTQYIYNMLVLNPAYAGADEALSATLFNRNQWMAIEGAPVTQTLSVHGLATNRFGVGLSFINDKIGIHKQMHSLIHAAYTIPVTDLSRLTFGLQGGAQHVRSDYQSLLSTNDPRVNDQLYRETATSLGAGVRFHRARLNVSFSVPELLPSVNVANNEAVRWNKLHYFFLTQYRFSINPILDLQPTILIKYYTATPLSVDFNSNFIFYDVLTLGVSYRLRESVAGMMQAKLTHQLRVGYGYDAARFRQSAINSGSHEVMVQYIFKYIEKDVVSPR